MLLSAFNEEVEQGGVGIDGKISHRHLGQLVNAFNLEFGCCRMRFRARVVEVRFTIDHVAHAPEVASRERIGLERRNLAHIASAENAIREHDHDAAAARLRAACQGNRLQKVHWAVSRGGRGGAHGAGQDDGLVGLDDEVQEVRCLVECVGAVCDHESVDVRLGCHLVDSARKCNPVFGGDVVGVDVANLHRSYVSNVMRAFRHADECVDVELARPIVRCFANRTFTCNCAPCCKHHNGGERRVDFAIGVDGFDGHGASFLSATAIYNCMRSPLSRK